MVNKEVSILQKYRGPNIVSILGFEVNRAKREALILLEYCPGGHLLHRLNARKELLPVRDVCRIFGQLLAAVQPFHCNSSPPLIHRDLKLENILFGRDGNIKLCDFGSAVTGYTFLRTVEEKSRAEEQIGRETTQSYRAPEMVDLYMREELTEKTDIWVSH